MATHTYICKCGRKVRKNTSAENTGNRDTESCTGCPYLLPWGPMEWNGAGFKRDVQGYECRMSKKLEYATRFSGSIDDKLTCSIVSLDFEFLGRVSEWIEEHYPEELFGRFDRTELRGVEYVSNGRYRLSISCVQNKKGMQAKAALLKKFFNPDGSRLDKTPEEEKAIVLDAIEDGKAQANKKEEKPMIYKDPANDNEPQDAVAESVPAGAAGLTAFDYSGLEAQTVADLHLAEREYSSGKKMAEMGLRRMADAVAIAHDALIANCEGHNQHSEDTFSAWCRSIDLKKDAAYRMLQVSKLMDDSSPREQKVLEELSPSLLYAAAKPSAPAELVRAVKDGDITTHKQYQEALAEIKARDEKIRDLLEMSEASDRRADNAVQELKQVRQDAALDRKEREDAHAAAMRYKSECDRRAQDQKRVEELLEHQKQLTAKAQQDARGWEEAGMQTQEIVEDLQGQLAEKNARIKELESGQVIEATAIDQTEIDRRVQQAVAAENAKWEELCQSQQQTISALKREGSVAAQVKSITSAVENLLDGLLYTVQNEGVSAENCMAVDGLLDTLQGYYNDFYDLMEGEERGGAYEDE